MTTVGVQLTRDELARLIEAITSGPQRLEDRGLWLKLIGAAERLATIENRRAAKCPS